MFLVTESTASWSFTVMWLQMGVFCGHVSDLCVASVLLTLYIVLVPAEVLVPYLIFAAVGVV